MRINSFWNFKILQHKLVVIFLINMLLWSCEAQRNKTKQHREGDNIDNVKQEDDSTHIQTPNSVDSLKTAYSLPKPILKTSVENFNRIPIANFYKTIENRSDFYFPQIELGVFYNDFSKKKIYKFSKYFADATAITPPKKILQAYDSLKNDPSFDIMGFVDQHFELPNPYLSQFTTDTDNSIVKHIERMWPKFTKKTINTMQDLYNSDKIKNTLLLLPNDFVVPGGKYTEMRYWDSFFIVLGLMASNQKELAIKILENSKFLIQKYGYIPLGTRTYYLGQSHPPVFSMMLDAVFGKNYSQITPYIDALIKENDFWMKTSLPKVTQGFTKDQRVMQFRTTRVNRYFADIPMPRTEEYISDLELFFSKNELSSTYTIEQLNLFTQIRSVAESGWDFSTRWLSNPKDKTSIEIDNLVPTDLNCYLYFQEDLLYRYYKFKGNEEQKNKYFLKSEKRGKIIAQYNWNDEKKFFTDYNMITGESKNHLNLSSVFPLICKIANLSQSKYVAERLEKEFLKPGGLLTSLEHSGEYWDSPYGVASLQYFAIKGLMNYGYISLAKKIKENWMLNVDNFYQRQGQILNVYNVINLDVKSQKNDFTQEGFAWTNGVYLHLLKNEPLLNK